MKYLSIFAAAMFFLFVPINSFALMDQSKTSRFKDAVFFHNLSADLELAFNFNIYDGNEKIYDDTLISFFFPGEEDDNAPEEEDTKTGYGLGLGLNYSLFVSIPNFFVFRGNPIFAMGIGANASFIGGNGYEGTNFISRIGADVRVKLFWLLNLSYGVGLAHFANDIDLISYPSQSLSGKVDYIGSDLAIPITPNIHPFISYYYYNPFDNDKIHWKAHNVKIGILAVF